MPKAPKFFLPFQQGEKAFVAKDLTAYIKHFANVQEILDVFASISDMKTYCDLVGASFEPDKPPHLQDSRSRSVWADTIFNHQLEWGRVIGVPTERLSPGMVFYDQISGTYVMVKEVIRAGDELGQIKAPQPVNWFEVSSRDYASFLDAHRRYLQSQNSYIVKGELYGDQVVSLIELTRARSTALVFLDTPVLCESAEGITAGDRYWSISSRSVDSGQISTVKQLHQVNDQAWAVLEVQTPGYESTDYNRVSVLDLKNLDKFQVYHGQAVAKNIYKHGKLNGFDFEATASFKKRRATLTAPMALAHDSRTSHRAVMFVEVIQSRLPDGSAWRAPTLEWSSYLERRGRSRDYDYRSDDLSVFLETGTAFSHMLQEAVQIARKSNWFFTEIAQSVPAIDGLQLDEEEAA